MISARGRILGKRKNTLQLSATMSKLVGNLHTFSKCPRESVSVTAAFPFPRFPRDDAAASLSPPSTGNPLRPLPWLLVPAASLAALLILAVLYVLHYVKGGKGVKTPEMLVRNVSAK